MTFHPINTSTLRFVRFLYQKTSIYYKIHHVKKDNIIMIINEELENFDFLGNDEYNKEKEGFDLLSNEDFQKQFICDSLLKRRDKLKVRVTDSGVGGNWETNNPEDISFLTLEYFTEIEYKYDPAKEAVKFTLNFDSDRISVSAGGYYNPGNWGRYEPPEGDTWYDSIDWMDINVTLFTMDGDEIEFNAFKRAPADIQNLFVREYVESYITTSTHDNKTREKINKPAIINSYC
jgi:hypothetical protein